MDFRICCVLCHAFFEIGAGASFFVRDLIGRGGFEGMWKEEPPKLVGGKVDFGQACIAGGDHQVGPKD